MIGEMRMDTELSDQARIHKAYLDQRSSFNVARLDYSKRFDQALFALSGGGLTLSLTFAAAYLPHQNSQATSLLLWVWILFGATVLGVLVSMRLTELAYSNSMVILDEEVLKGADHFHSRVRKRQTTEPFSRWSRAIRLACIVTLFGAVVLWGIIALIVIQEPRSHGQETTEATQAGPTKEHSTG